MIKNIRILFIFILVLGTHNAFSQRINEGYSELVQDQKEIVARLTGKTEIKQHYFLNSRYTEDERKITRWYLKKCITKAALKSMEHKYCNTYPDTTGQPQVFEGENIYTIVPSTIWSNDYVVVGAHFDSVENCPGANDNATGVALVYGVLKKLVRLNYRSKNVIVVFFDQEEQGMIGSMAFAEYIVSQKLMRIHSVHTIDQMGWDEDGDRAIELELPTEYLKNKYIAQAQKAAIPIYITDVDIADHKSFRDLRYNAVGITEEYMNEDTTPYYHLPEDTYETINFEYLESSTQLVFIVLKEIIVSGN